MPSLAHALLHPAERLSSWALRVRREIVFSDRIALAALVVLTIALTVLGVINKEVFPQTALLVPMFLGSLWLWPKSLPWFVVFCLACVIVLVLVQPVVNWRSVVRVSVTFMIAFVIMWTSFRRAQLGVSGPRGESMLVDLRDRIIKQGRIPALPPQWHVESATRSAGGTKFAGDFIVATKSLDGSTIEVLVVDVSGKGVEAGTRALLLSGAFGGLASAIPPEQFLMDANEYLLRQDWAEGFATAIHLHLCLHTGDFEVRKAGHPPAVWLHAGTGSWSVLDSEGPVLGLIPESGFGVVKGRLCSGDALLLFTDGLVESTRRDLSSGIDRLVGHSQRLLQVGFDGGAARLIGELASSRDDGAIVVVHHRAVERMTGIEPA